MNDVERFLALKASPIDWKAARESSHRFEALYVLAIGTGLRRAELLGLRWDAADLERGTLHVGRALIREGAPDG